MLVRPLWNYLVVVSGDEELAGLGLHLLIPLQSDDCCHKFDGESRRQLHVTELPQFVKVFVWSNNLQNVQESAVGELHTSFVYLHTPCIEYDVMTIIYCWWFMY
jgi:hypothetical protein